MDKAGRRERHSFVQVGRGEGVKLRVTLTYSVSMAKRGRYSVSRSESELLAIHPKSINSINGTGERERKKKQTLICVRLLVWRLVLLRVLLVLLTVHGTLKEGAEE